MMVTKSEKVHNIDKSIDVQPTDNQQSLIILLPTTKTAHYTVYTLSKTVFCHFCELFNPCLTEFDCVHGLTV
jgi:hypothetical protein